MKRNWKHLGEGLFKCLSFKFFDIQYNVHTKHLTINAKLDVEEWITPPSPEELYQMRKVLFDEELCTVLSNGEAPTRSASDELDKNEG